MNPVSITYDPVTTILGEQTPINLDFIPLTETFVGVYVSGGPGSAFFTVEITIDDVNDPSVEPRWFALKGAPTDDTDYVSFTHPVRFIRLNIAALINPIEFKIAQAQDCRC